MRLASLDEAEFPHELERIRWARRSLLRPLAACRPAPAKEGER